MNYRLKRIIIGIAIAVITAIMPVSAFAAQWNPLIDISYSVDSEYDSYVRDGAVFIDRNNLKSTVVSYLQSNNKSELKVFYAHGVDTSGASREQIEESIDNVISTDVNNVSTWASEINQYGSYYAFAYRNSQIGASATNKYAQITITRVCVYNEANEQAAISKADVIAASFTGSSYNKIKSAYDWLLANNSYDYGYSKYSSYDALIGGCSVCEGYTNAFELMMEACGIESYIVIGVQNGQNHSWNVVKLDGAYYYVDATWGDTSNQSWLLFGTNRRSNTSALNIMPTDYVPGSQSAEPSVETTTPASTTAVQETTAEPVASTDNVIETTADEITVDDTESITEDNTTKETVSSISETDTTSTEDAKTDTSETTTQYTHTSSGRKNAGRIVIVIAVILAVGVGTPIIMALIRKRK